MLTCVCLLMSVVTAAGCRKVVQERVLNEMLGGIQDTTGGGWKVLILDSVTTRILSSAMRMSDIMDAGAQQHTHGWSCVRLAQLGAVHSKREGMVVQHGAACER